MDIQNGSPRRRDGNPRREPETETRDGDSETDADPARNPHLNSIHAPEMGPLRRCFGGSPGGGGKGAGRFGNWPGCLCRVLWGDSGGLLENSRRGPEGTWEMDRQNRAAMRAKHTQPKQARYEGSPGQEAAAWENGNAK